MSLLQAQRIPLGNVTLAGRKVPVYITFEWLKALQSLEDGTSSGSSGGGTSSGSSGGSGASTSTADTVAIESAYQLALTVQSIAISLAQRLQGVENDATTAALRAEVDRLRSRVEALEMGP